MIKPKSEHGVDAEETKKWIREFIGEDVEVEVVDFAPWRAGAALGVERYKTGRIFQLGDAAHLFTPVGSFGMNTGVGDAHNLAWKLAAVTQGWGGTELLDSYENERRPIGFRNTGAARKYSSRMQDLVCPPHLEEDTPAGEMARKEVIETSYVKYNHFNKQPVVDCTGVQLGARYDDSSVIVYDVLPPRDRFPETYDKYFPSGVPGGRAPHIWMEDGEKRIENANKASLFDRLDSCGFTLLRIMRSDYDVSTIERAASARRVPFKVVDVDRPEAQALYVRSLVLVRPDQYIAWRGDELPEDPEALLAHVTGF